MGRCHTSHSLGWAGLSPELTFPRFRSFLYLSQLTSHLPARALRGIVKELRLTANLHTTIRARAPLRLGLAGGGTDLSPYCDQFGGAVLNTTIDRFAYAFISPRDDGKVVFRAKDLGREEVLEAAPQLPQASLPLQRGVYERLVRDHNAGKAIS